jgi:hypothetical protein
VRPQRIDFILAADTSLPDVAPGVTAFMPGTFQAVCNGKNAFIDLFLWALRNKVRETDITVTCLMPGPTDTEIFERADVLDTNVGAGNNANAAEVAKIGFAVMMNGESDFIVPTRLTDRPNCSPEMSLRRTSTRKYTPSSLSFMKSPPHRLISTCVRGMTWREASKLTPSLAPDRK